MPILRVMLNKLSSDWQVARAVLEDEYQASSTWNKNVTRLKFVAHIFDVHRTSCGACPSGLGVRSSRDTAIGHDGSASCTSRLCYGQRKVYVSASTQTTDRSHLDAPARDLPDSNDDDVGNINVNEMAFPLAMTGNLEDKELRADVNTSQEKPSNEKGIKQEHHEDEITRDNSIQTVVQRDEDPIGGWCYNAKSSSLQDLAAEQTNVEKKIQVSYLLIKEEDPSQEYCDIGMDSDTCKSASHQRPDQARIPTHASRSDPRSDSERPNQHSIPHIKQEIASQEHCDVDMDSSLNEVTSHHRLRDDIPTQDTRSVEKTIFYNSNEPSTSHIHDVCSPEGVFQERCNTDWMTALGEFSRPSGSTHSGHVRSSGLSLQDRLPADYKTISGNISGPPRCTHVSGICRPEGSQDPFSADGKTTLESIGEPLRSANIGDVQRPDGSSQDTLPADTKSISGNIRKSSRSTHVSDMYSPDVEGFSEDRSCPAGMDSCKKMENTARPKRTRFISCPPCNKKHTFESDFHAHQRKHRGAKPRLETKALPGEKPYQCLKCLQEFSRKHSLQRHLKFHAREKPHQCSICNKRFAQTGQVKSHMRSHTGEKPYECSYCDMKFSYSIDLSRHIYKHTGKKPFQCAICDKTFSRHDKFSGHMRMHQGEKPYCCSRCTYRCSEKRSLKAHMRRHNGEKPYQCLSCDRSYSRQYTLTKHVKGHLAGKHFCSLCDKAFTTKDALDRHLKKKKPSWSNPHI